MPSVPATPDAPEARVAVILASAGRPDLLAEVVADLARQTLTGFDLVVSVPDTASLPAQPLPPHVRVVHARGLTTQRNAGLDAVPEATHVFFFDDDAVVRPDYLEQAMRFFERHPDVVALTGRVLLDGAVGEAISTTAAAEALAASQTAPLGGQWTPSQTLYGCNFAVKRTGVPHERFDERLPLYGWLEDHDYARRMLRHGLMAKADDCVIVHRGVKSGGRTAHARLGYAQVMNPAYLHHKGSFPPALAWDETMRRVSKNAVLSLGGPEREWRRLRLRGNLLAAADLLRRRFTPERMAQLPPDGR
nr:glycosyltransferase [Quadrisphaera sp. RL12-1S]